MSSVFEGNCDTTYPVNIFIKLRGKPILIEEIVNPLQSTIRVNYIGPPRPYRKFRWDNLELISTKDVVKGVETILNMREL